MQVRYVYHEDYQFCYSFRGRPGHKPSILMLHGFSAHKDMWLSVVKVRSRFFSLNRVSLSKEKGVHLNEMSSAMMKSQGNPELWLKSSEN